jgi:ribosomal-protein-alanine N-acetyltransferase
MVAETGEEVAGFMIYELDKNRLHLINFAVDPKIRRAGIGSAMVQKLIGKLTHQRRCRLTTVVRETNLGCAAVFQSQWA